MPSPHPWVNILVVLGAATVAGGACRKPSPPSAAARDAAGPVDAGDARAPANPAEAVVRTDFGKKYRCPEDRVAVKARPDADPQLSMARDDERSLGKAPSEVKNDPERYAKWKADNLALFARRMARYVGYSIWEVTGCGHTDFIGCHDYVSHAGSASYSGGPPDCSDAKPPAVTVAALGSAALTDQWRPLAAPPIAGAYAPFDVVGNLDWASSIATAWSADAALFLVDVTSIKHDGTVDLSVDGASTAQYFYRSAGKGTELGIEVNPVVDRLHGTGARVEVNPPRDARPRRAIGKPACTLAQAIAALTSGGVLSKAHPRVDYKAELWTSATGSFWRITYRDSLPNDPSKTTDDLRRDVDASTCKVAPPGRN